MTITKTWQKAFQNKKFSKAFGFSVLAFFVLITATKFFLVFNESRTGYPFQDPILNLFNPIDVTWLTFLLLWVTALLGIIILIQTPKDALLFLISYTFLLGFRMTTMFFVPLAPPEKMILLHDPVVSTFAGHGTPIKDLFFSGHTATMFLFFLAVRKFKPFFLFSSVVIAILVVAQHAHYSVDVIFAPLFAYFALKLGQKLTEFLSVKI